MSQQQMQQLPPTLQCPDGGHDIYLARFAYARQLQIEATMPVTYPKQRTLSDKLKPPVEPVLKSAVTNALKALGCLVFVIAEAIIAIPFALILVKAGLIHTPLTGIGNIIVGLCALVVAVVVVRRITRKKREELEREYTSQMRAYNLAKARYDRMYYCYDRSMVLLFDRRTNVLDTTTWTHEDNILPFLYKQTW